MYEYKASFIRVIDGDTVVLDIDLGFHVTLRQTVRLAGINTAELHSANPVEREKAIKARDAITIMLVMAKLVIARTEKPYAEDKYGRMLAWLTADGVDVNAALVGRGLAVKYDGGKK